MIRSFVFIMLSLLFSFQAFGEQITYDRVKSVEYALKYTNPNNASLNEIASFREYYNTAEYPLVLEWDCTNFISQVLYTGGIPESIPAIQNPIIYNYLLPLYYWFYENEVTSRTWITTDYFYKRLKKYSNIKEVKASQLQLGDLIFLDYTKDDEQNHVFVVTEKSENDLLVTCRGPLS